MPLRPEDVVRASFTMSRLRQGYDVSEVDSFLDEVVDELRRLHTRIDELEADAPRAPEQNPDPDSERVRRERQQLDLIRRERADLVEEMRQLHGPADAAAEGEDHHNHPGSLQGQVRELQEELSHVRQQHLELRERMLALVHDQLNVLQTGRDHLTLNGSADAPQVR